MKKKKEILRLTFAALSVHDVNRKDLYFWMLFVDCVIGLHLSPEDRGNTFTRNLDELLSHCALL
jgi:hypothetical protein